MNTNVLATVAALSDQDLLARLSALAGRERETLAELLAHLAGLDERPNVYAAQGYGSTRIARKRFGSPKTLPAIGSSLPECAAASRWFSICSPPAS